MSRKIDSKKSVPYSDALYRKNASCRTVSPAAVQLRKLVAAGEISDTAHACIAVIHFLPVLGNTPTILFCDGVFRLFQRKNKKRNFDGTERVVQNSVYTAEYADLSSGWRCAGCPTDQLTGDQNILYSVISSRNPGAEHPDGQTGKSRKILFHGCQRRDKIRSQPFPFKTDDGTLFRNSYSKQEEFT